MRKLFGVDLKDALPFIICAVVYVVLALVWLAVPLIAGSSATVSVADSEMTFIRGVIPVLGDLPPQSISKVFVTAMLYLLALVYALVSLAGSDYRKDLPQFIGLSALTFLAWMALNYWVIAGFLNSPATLLYSLITIVLLVVWAGGVMRFVTRLHDSTALFLVRFGLGLSAFITILQIVAVVTGEWRSPNQGIPVLYTLTLNGLVGVFLAGAGSNMLWREKRAQVLAAASKRR
jgi:hypothetical protein